MKILCVVNNTMGHTYPMLSILDRYLQNNDHEVLFLGVKGRIEEDILLKYNSIFINFGIINIKNLFKNIKGCYQINKILNKEKPDVIISCGGFLSFVVNYISFLKGIPFYIIELNHLPGLANIIISKYAEKVYVTYEDTERYFDSNDIYKIDYPVREEIINMKFSTKKYYEEFNLDPNKKTLLIIGNTLGSKIINESIIETLNNILNHDIQIFWQTGSYYYDEIIANIKKDNNIIITKYIKDIYKAYSFADLVITTCGANVLAELQYLNIKSIIVPFERSKFNHQYKNAKCKEYECGFIKMVISKEELVDQINKNLPLEKNKILIVNNPESNINLNLTLNKTKNFSFFGSILNTIKTYILWKIYHQFDIDFVILNIKLNPSYIKFEEINPNIINALISLEDKKFYYHSGFNIFSIFMAILRNFKNIILYFIKKNNRLILYGGSTISQQLVKNLLFNHKRSFIRKIYEFLQVIVLERFYTKNEILELYLNCVFFGGHTDAFLNTDKFLKNIDWIKDVNYDIENVDIKNLQIYGIKKASLFYFQKLPKDLNILESAFLVSILNRPSYYYNQLLINKQNDFREIKNRMIKTLLNIYYLGYLSKEKLIKNLKDVPNLFH